MHIKGVDADGSGVIDYTEFLAATLDRQSRLHGSPVGEITQRTWFIWARQQYMKEDVCWAAFRVFDRNGDGHISKDELKQARLFLLPSEPALKTVIPQDHEACTIYDSCTSQVLNVGANILAKKEKEKEVTQKTRSRRCRPKAG